MGFPGLDLDEQGESIEGFVLSSEELAEHWPRLDASEGGAYGRLTEVRLGDGQMVEAYLDALRAV